MNPDPSKLFRKKPSQNSLLNVEVSFTVTNDEFKYIAIEANRLDMSMSEYIRFAIAAFIAGWQTKAENSIAEIADLKAKLKHYEILTDNLENRLKEQKRNSSAL